MIDYVPKKAALNLANRMRDAMDARKRHTHQAPASASAAAATDVVSQLERLAALRDRGVLTPEEFAAQKAKILA